MELRKVGFSVVRTPFYQNRSRVYSSILVTFSSFECLHHGVDRRYSAGAAEEQLPPRDDGYDMTAEVAKHRHLASSFRDFPGPLRAPHLQVFGVCERGSDSFVPLLKSKYEI